MKQTQNESKRLTTVKSFCKKHDINNTLLYHWVRERAFPFFKVGKKIIFYENDLLDFLEKNRVEKDIGEIS